MFLLRSALIPRKFRAGAVLNLGLALVVLAAARGEDPQVLRGEWVATAEPDRTYRGRWIGQALPGQPDALHGSWTLSGQGGRTILRGTWEARRTGRGWSGTWSAEDQTGRKLSGRWQSEAEGARGVGFEDLLKRTLSERISGSWQTRGRSGHWWLQGTPPANGR